MNIEEYAQIRKNYVSLVERSYKHYRSTLNKYEQEIYDVIFGAILSFKDKVQIKNLSIAPKRLFDIYDYVKRDIPFFFFLKGDSSYTTRNNNVDFKFPFKMDVKQILDCSYAIMLKLLEYQVVCKNKSNLQKITYVHNKIVLNTLYSKGVEDPYSAYSVLVLGKGVCAGYAKALKLVLDAVGVNSLYVSGHVIGGSANGHAWNMVDIGGNSFYHVDATFDDSMQDNNIISYDHFILTDEQMRETHIFNMGSFRTPTKEIDYFTASKRCYSDFDTFREDLIEVFKNEEETFYFRFDRTFDYDEVEEEISEIIQEVLRSYRFNVNQWRYYSNKDRNTLYFTIEYR